MATPSDVLRVYIAEWLTLYRVEMSPLTVTVIEFWSAYFFKAIWWLLLAALLIQFKPKLPYAVVIGASFLAFLFLGGYWLGMVTLPFPLTYNAGRDILMISVVAFVVLVAFIWYRLRTEGPFQ